MLEAIRGEDFRRKRNFFYANAPAGPSHSSLSWISAVFPGAWHKGLMLNRVRDHLMVQRDPLRNSHLDRGVTVANLVP